jgi:hypothetical protein
VERGCGVKRRKVRIMEEEVDRWLDGLSVLSLATCCARTWKGETLRRAAEPQLQPRRLVASRYFLQYFPTWACPDEFQDGTTRHLVLTPSFLRLCDCHSSLVS